MFWIVVLAVIACAFGVAWWTSGRAAGRRDAIEPTNDDRQNAAQEQHSRNHIQGTLGPP